jgi:hypothetical protein
MMRKGPSKRSLSERSPSEQENKNKKNPVAQLLTNAASKVKEAIKTKDDSNVIANDAILTTFAEGTARGTSVTVSAGHFTFDEDENRDTTPKYKEAEEKEKSDKVQKEDLISPYDQSEEQNLRRGTKIAKSNQIQKRSNYRGIKSTDTSSQRTPPRRGRVDPNITVDNDGDSVASGPSNQLLREQEDDANTIGSGVTTVRDRVRENEIVLPPFVRYQLMIMPGQDKDSGTTDDDNDDDPKSPTEIVRDYLQKFYKEMKRCDDRAEIISSIMKPNFTYLPADKFPQDVVEMARYFKGFRRNIKPGKRVYVSLAIHTPGNALELERQLENWAQLYAFTFRRTIIQSESATCIGWLAYSSYYTDTHAIRAYLMENSNFEWGFRIQAVTKADADKKWNERTRALAVYVPTSKTQVAISLISLCMEAEKDANDRQLHLFDKYLFVRPEYAMKSRHNSIIFKSIIRRHNVHTKCLRAQLCTNIICNVDEDMKDSFGQRWSLRDIILHLRVYDKKNPLYNTSLFHSIDYVEDTSKLWIDGAEGPGGAAHVFTFYDTVQMEAEEFIMGLGRYIARTRGKRMALAMFDSDHFDASSQWKWDTEKMSFITPIKKLAYANLRYDNNLPAIKALHLMEVQRQKEEKEEAEKAKRMLQRLAAPNTDIPAMLNVIPAENEPHIQQQHMDTQNNDTNSDNSKRGGAKNITRETGSRSKGKNKKRRNDNVEADTKRKYSQPIDTTNPPIMVEEVTVHHDNSTIDEEQLELELQGEENTLLLKILQPDLDSLDGMDEEAKSKVKNIYLNDEEVSQSSTITDNTQGSILPSTASVASRASLQSVSSNSDSIRSLLTINKDIVQRLMKPGMSKEELEQRVEAYFAVQLQKAKDKKECAKETFIQELIQEDKKQQNGTHNLKQDTSPKRYIEQQQQVQTEEEESNTGFSEVKLQQEMTYETDSQRKDRVAKMKEPLMVPEEVQLTEKPAHTSSNEHESTPPEIDDQALNFKNEPPDNIELHDTVKDSKVHVSGQNTDDTS